mgnify:CR=1 FL=1
MKHLTEKHPTDLLPDYLLGDLSPAEVTELEAHLADCGSCQEELAWLGAPLAALTDALPRSLAPERVWQGLQSRFQEAVAESIQAETIQAESSEETVESAPILVDHPPPVAPPYRWLMAACFLVAALGGSLFWGWQNYGARQQLQAEAAQLNSYLARPQVQKVSLENVIGSERGESPGSALLTPEGKALFVLAENAPAGSAYQAWGHTSGDWDPEGGETLTSLLVSESKVFEVEGANFASLYLSLEPASGSPQPTQPLTKVSLTRARPEGLLELILPEEGAALTANRVIVGGTVGESVLGLSYRLNSGEASEVSFTNNRFSFTVNGLIAGQNVIELSASSADRTVRKSVSVSYDPQ